MPAAAVIPAPIAYIKVVAVKKFVVGFWVWWGAVRLIALYCPAGPLPPSVNRGWVLVDVGSALGEPGLLP